MKATKTYDNLNRVAGIVNRNGTVPPVDQRGDAMTGEVRRLHKSIGIFAVGTVFILGFWIILVTPPPPPSHSLDYSFNMFPTTNGTVKSLAITLSNCSDFTVQYGGSARCPWFVVYYQSNGVTSQMQVGSVVGTTCSKLNAHEVIRSVLEVSDRVSSLKLSLQITSLSWRGRAAWSIGWLPRPVVGFLFRQDEDHRSKTEWSAEYLLDKTNQPIP